MKEMTMDIIDVSLKDIFKDRSYPEGGTELFNIASKAILEGSKVHMDMRDIGSMPTLFMNTSFGNLIDLYGLETAKGVFIFSHVKQNQIDRIKKYFDDYMTMLEEKKEQDQ